MGLDDEYVLFVICILTFIDGFYFPLFFFIFLYFLGIVTCLMVIMNVYSSWSLVEPVVGGRKMFRPEPYRADRLGRIDVSQGGTLTFFILVLEQSTTLASCVCLVTTIVLPTFCHGVAAISKTYRVCFGEGCNALS